MSELLATGFEITLIGMGVVFALLTLLVFVVEGMSRLARYLEGEPAEPAPAPTRPGDERLAAVITAAIHAYRARHKRR